MSQERFGIANVSFTFIDIFQHVNILEIYQILCNIPVIFHLAIRE